MDLNTNEIYPPVTNKVKDGAVMLPISDECLLIGSIEKNIPLPSLSLFNENIAELSAEFFVSSVNSSKERLLAKRIGTRSKLIEDWEIDEIERDIFGES